MFAFRRSPQISAMSPIDQDRTSFESQTISQQRCYWIKATTKNDLKKSNTIALQWTLGENRTRTLQPLPRIQNTKNGTYMTPWHAAAMDQKVEMTIHYLMAICLILALYRRQEVPLQNNSQKLADSNQSTWGQALINSPSLLLQILT